MAEKTLNTRIINKHDIEANWLKATGFTPKQGEIIVYDKDSTHNYERIKIGDGSTLVSALPFVDDALRTELIEQIEDTKVIEGTCDSVNTVQTWIATIPSGTQTTYNSGQLFLFKFTVESSTNYATIKIGEKTCAIYYDNQQVDGSFIKINKWYLFRWDNNSEKLCLVGEYYTHPTYTKYDSGLYKVSVDSTGHIDATTAVTKDDITALGIPAQDTTYSAATTKADGLLSASDKSKLDGIAAGATKITVDKALDEKSTNPVQNMAVASQISKLGDLIGDTAVSKQISTAISEATADDFGVYVQDTEPAEAVAGDIWIDTINDPSYIPPTIPEITEADNGKVLMVVNGKLQLVSLNLSVDASGVLSV